ncbi:helix-turn-helix domain-containing protein [Microbaculum sp. FT89]|uniref:helix-turn-helix domain-containing protein n=1 Tax=Microbaculum sp. FT89 TaxID=3447298 RepID=UPI003F5372D4
MTRKRPSARQVKKNWTYEVKQLARLVGVHPNTVRRWISKDGLEVVDDRRPFLIRGEAAQEFLGERKQSRKCTLKPGEIYCLGCRAPKRPAGNMADYLPLGAERGSLQGLCPDCGGLIYRGVSPAKLDAVRADLDIAFTEALQRIGGCA